MFRLKGVSLKAEGSGEETETICLPPFSTYSGNGNTDILVCDSDHLSTSSGTKWKMGDSTLFLEGK